MSQFSDITFLSRDTPFQRRRRSRSRSRSPERTVMTTDTRRRARLRPRNMKGNVHQFTRMTTTNQNFNDSGTTTNWWALNNRVDQSISYGGTTPNQYGNQISIYFDLLAAHIDLYTNLGAPVAQTVYKLPNVSEFVALYEEYRIDWVQIDCYASQENAYRAGSSPGDTASFSPIIYYVKDYNDADSTSITQMMQQEDVGEWQPGVGNNGTYHRRIRVKPKANFTVANQAMVGVGIAKVPGLSWMTIEDSQNIPHYGVKMAVANFFPQSATLNQPSIYLAFTFTYHLSFRNVK